MTKSIKYKKDVLGETSDASAAQLHGVVSTTVEYEWRYEVNWEVSDVVGNRTGQSVSVFFHELYEI